MCILIQDPETKAFYDGDDWDPNENQAIRFGTMTRAEECCRRQNLFRAAVVVKYKDGCNVSYRVGERNYAHLMK